MFRGSGCGFTLECHFIRLLVEREHGDAIERERAVLRPKHPSKRFPSTSISKSSAQDVSLLCAFADFAHGNAALDGVIAVRLQRRIELDRVPMHLSHAGGPHPQVRDGIHQA
jgi:hypothetical protein